MKNEKKKKGLLLSALGTGIASVGLMIAASVTPAHEIGSENNGDAGDGENKITLNEGDVYAESKEKESIIDKIPMILRSIIAVPLMIIGTLLLKLMNAALKVIAMPIVSFLLGWLGIFLLLLLIILICLKLIFPDKKLRELINKKLIITVLIGSFIIRLTQVILPKVWNGYSDYEFAITLCEGLTVILIVLIPALIHKAKEPTLVYNIDDI